MTPSELALENESNPSANNAKFALADLIAGSTRSAESSLLKYKEDKNADLEEGIFVFK
jgi:hypothetical protein